MSAGRTLLLTYEFAPFRGGIASVAEGLAGGLAEVGHDVHVLAPDYFANQNATDATFPFTVHRFAGDFCSILSIDKLTRFARVCRHWIRAIRPERVHAVDPQSQMALTLLARFGMAPRFTTTVHGTELLRYRREFVPRVWMHGGLRRAAHVFAVSNAVREMVLTGGFATDDCVSVVYPGIAARWLDTPRSDAVRERARWQIPPDAFVLLTIGRRVRAKGHLRVIAALAALPAELRQRCCYLVVGDGPDTYARELDDAATQAGVRLVLAGRLDDANTIAAADASNLFIMPSLETPRRLEGFGIAYVEAAARGLPSVAVATGGVAEAVRDGETGIVLPPDAPHAAIADAISRFASDPAMTAAMSQAGNQWANEFMWRRHAEQVNARMANTGR